MARKEGNRPAASVQRSSTPPRASSGQHDARGDHSPPRTPPSRVAPHTSTSKGAGDARAPRNRPALVDAFGEQARETGENHTRNRNNSHELSWSPNKNIRASVVDNMLASLDQFSVTTTTTQNLASAVHTTTTTTLSQPGDYDPFYYAGQNHSLPGQARQRSHTISSSVSSEHSLQCDSPTSRGHRSNSSNNFHSSLGRIDSVRLADDADTRVGRSRTTTTTVGPAVLYAGARKGSKSSGSSSVDLGAMGGNPRMHRGPERRSSSFDHGSHRPAFAPHSMGKQETYFYDNLDAAPNPTIPVGPRRNDSRNASPAPSAHYRPDQTLAGNQHLPMKRRGSIRSPMAIFQRPERSDAIAVGDPEKDSTPRPHKVSDVHGNNDMSSINTPERGPTRSQHNQSGSTPNSGNMAKDKERPGFFKRVFGSSRSHNQFTPQESTPSHSKNFSMQNGMAPMNRTENVAPGPGNRKPTKPSQLPPSQKASASDKSQAKEPAPPTLNKKTSFFRRRKKSVTETSSVPLPNLELQPQWQAPRALQVEKSPVSSLRYAMDPYLSNGPGSKPGPGLTRESEQPEIEEYTSRPTIRTVTQRSEEEVRGPTDDDLTRYISDDHPPSSVEGRTHDGSAPHPDRRPPAPPRVSSGTMVQEEKSNAQSTPLTEAILPKRTSSADWIESSVATGMIKEQAVPPPPSSRVWIEPTASEDNLATPKRPAAPADAQHADAFASSSTVNSDYQSANSKQQSPTTPSLKKEKGTEALNAAAPAEVVDHVATGISPRHIPIITNFDDSVPTDEDRVMAEKLFAGGSIVSAADTAAWLGDAGPDRARVRRAYMSIFDWHNMSILSAIRSFCSQVKLKGESQQVDRLLEALSARWVECNPDHGFKAIDVVHTICYSLLLLNTDLHMADIDSKMTKGQFIKNTMPTVLRVVADAAPDAFPPVRGSMLPPPRSAGQDIYGSSPSGAGRPTNKLMSRPSDNSTHDGMGDMHTSSEDCGPLVKAPFVGRQSAWENQVEIVLKNFYLSIRDDRLPLLRPEAPKAFHSQPSSTSLSANTGGMLRRTNSLLSKAGSESLPVRSRLADNKSISSRFTSKTRSRPRLYQASLGRASRTSFDDDMSAISPSASSMWSKYSMGKTQTSMSVNSYSSDFPPRGDYQSSIGFANALSQAIIREDASIDSHEEVMRVVPLLEDESLELAGAPWAKEGMLKHKHHLESVDKKAKDRNWSEVFAVVDKGWMRLFQFNVSARSMRQKARNQMAGGVVGGGNWTENAEPLGKFPLRQTLASALPPPGYSRARPHVFALSLPSGAVHLFQAGTPDIVREYVSAANYWSARMSKEPLIGGISNIEYGWSDAVINMALVGHSPSSSSHGHGPRPSLQNSIRSSIDHQGNARPKLPGDRITINDWTPPQVTLMESQLLEVDQLRALTNYVKNVEDELSRHNELRPAITLAFSSRHPNAGRAMNNWERKSSYLLREIVKFRTYIDSLQQAQIAKDKIYKDREDRERERQVGYEHEEENSVAVGKELETA